MFSMHKEIITNAVTDGKASGWGWENCTVECMSETMVYGTQIWGDNGFEVGAERTQLPLFMLKPEHTIVRDNNWWLRSVADASNFAQSSGEGRASYATASSKWVGIRPAFAIYQAAS